MFRLEHHKKINVIIIHVLTSGVTELESSAVDYVRKLDILNGNTKNKLMNTNYWCLKSVSINQ